MRIRQQLLLAAMLLFSYAYVLPRWADWNQNSRLNLVRALSEQGTVIIDRYVDNTGDYALFRGHTYSDKAPGPAFLALPVALALQPILALAPVQAKLDGLAQAGVFGATLNPAGSGIQREKVQAFIILLIVSVTVSALPTTLGALALWGLLRRLGSAEQPALLVTIAYGLATMIAVYASSFYSHALVAALLIGAWAVAIRPYSAVRSILIGLLLGWVVISEYPAALAAGVIGLAAAWHWRKLPALGWMALGGLPPLLLMATYDWVAFGTLLPTGYEHSALWQQQHQTGFVSLTYPHSDALIGLTFGLYRGMFVRAPWLLLALPGYLIWWHSGRARAHWWVALLAPVSLLLVYGSSGMWWGGFAAGPRYLVATIPFLAVASAPMIEWLWVRRLARGALLLLILASAVLTWSEALARQSFPPDTILNPWLGYTLPAWQTGDIARNLGTAVGLQGALALVPLVVLMIGLLLFCFYDARHSAPACSVGEAS